MTLIKKPLTAKEINNLKKQFGEYFKITADVKIGNLVAGCKLHADGEKVLLEQGSNQKNIWGGGINLVDKEIDGTAVLNYRPNLNNPSMEILDSQIRNKFFEVIKNIFNTLWI